MMSRTQWRMAIGLAILAGAIGWAYWPTFTSMAARWTRDPQYSHGFLVPLFAAYLLWQRRRLAPTLRSAASRWGLILVAIGISLHIAGACFYFDALATVSVLPLLAGLCVCWGGWPALWWTWPAIGFLVFMVPLPFRVEGALSLPLQRLATNCSNYALQTLGFATVAEGNVIILDNARIGVVEACNGLGMLVAFFAMTTATVLLVRRSILEKLLLLPSAIPIAVIANVLRITATGMLHALVGGEVADMVFHNLAGWLMMPVALGILCLEIRLLGILLVDPEPEGTPMLGLALSNPRAANVNATLTAKV